MLYDIDGDGTNDVGVVDKNGNLFWIRVGEHGQYLEDYHIQVPKLKIMRNWHTGLDPVFVDNYILTAMFDHKSSDRAKQYGYGTGTEKPLFSKSKDDPVDAAATKKIKPDALGFRVQQDTYPELYKYSGDSKTDTAPAAPIHGRRLLSVEDSEEQENIPSEPKNLDGNAAQGRIEALSSAVASNIVTDKKPLESVVVEKKEENRVDAVKPNDGKPLENIEPNRVLPVTVTDPVSKRQEESSADRRREELSAQQEAVQQEEPSEGKSGSELEGPEFRPEDELKDDYVPP